MSFDTIVVVDWSGASSPSPVKPSKDAIWIGVARRGTAEVETSYHRTRHDATETLAMLFEAERAAGRRVLAGFDFPFGYPRGFAEAVSGEADPLTLWRALSDRIEDAPDNANNRFAVAAGLNDVFPGIGPFWGCPDNLGDPRLPSKGTLRHGHGMTERRACDRTKGAQPVWKLFTTGSVGSQALLGIARLQALRHRFGPDLAVRPFERHDAPITLVELFPSLIAPTVEALAEENEIKDRAQVRILAAALAQLAPRQLDAMTREGDAEEGWILGLGHETLLESAARAAFATPDPLEDMPKTDLMPPRLRDDCFAMPQGVSWVPVDDALAKLHDALHPVTGLEILPTARTAGRVLAADVTAKRSNPPMPNSAVDGYGFAHGATGTGVQRLPLVAGRAAAGQPYPHAVPPGHAIRILTGAILPEGVDTVVLEEDTNTDATTVVFDGPAKPRANTRKDGEDVAAGAPALPKGRRLRAPDLALASALGIGELPVHRPLRVGVVSTGDEIVAAPDRPAAPHQIWDANRPMLLALASGWHCEAVDLGHVPDDPEQIAARLDEGARKADVILTSGGASAGDEDHVSALLRQRGTLSSWRIALKPGRPLALAMWEGTPVFGLPGNPVAALVCALIFARPALSLMAGAGWTVPQGFTVPAAFSKRKKPGRREYLRARLTEDGHAEVFASEGSGRISGLSWADGLVELPDEAVEVTPGTPVRYIPYASFGLI
ncbi:molybdopterin-binding protein [Salipiger bermudensis]|uniref:Molybdopterin molybdenumtransferase n=1 Tax=Salipiger bermudensis (strain DSM 26914 / JCM 13377 / KCTC 12554 / HTCC2601) TaxID=314265 RepID=Q0FS76_SALBH|nr:gephyrin-like molybdotransferase Glp [Salipiger bermudensis]EAU47125.1 molybdopterin biosynthesis protein MoeA [Salipiger bermudensis HTCC2601]